MVRSYLLFASFWVAFLSACFFSSGYFFLFSRLSSPFVRIAFDFSWRVFSSCFFFFFFPWVLSLDLLCTSVSAFLFASLIAVWVASSSCLCFQVCFADLWSAFLQEECVFLRGLRRLVASCSEHLLGSSNNPPSFMPISLPGLCASMALMQMTHTR